MAPPRTGASRWMGAPAAPAGAASLPAEDGPALPVTVASVPSPARVRRGTMPGYPEDSGASVLQQLPQHSVLLLFTLSPPPRHIRRKGLQAVRGHLRGQVGDLVIPKAPSEALAHAELVAFHSGLSARLPEHCPPLHPFQNGYSLSSSIRFAQRWLSQLRPISPAVMDTKFACNVDLPLLLPLGWALLGCFFLLCPASTQLSLAAGQGKGHQGPCRSTDWGHESLHWVP